MAGKRSLQELGEAVVAAVQAKDADALRALAVGQTEYERLFPALASHANMRSLDPGLAWRMQDAESDGDMRSALSQHGGKPMTLVSLTSTTQEPRPGLVIHRDPQLAVRGEDGTERELEIVGVVVEHVASGTFAVLVFES